ncbi:MAG: hypothetical protein GX316_09620 [Firmicutes bacterium]|nr:hypothetical protein [Bacillota bacterium]
MSIFAFGQPFPVNVIIIFMQISATEAEAVVLSKIGMFLPKIAFLTERLCSEN